MSAGPPITLQSETTLVDLPDVPDPTVRIQIDGADAGPFTLRKLHDLSIEGKVTRNTPMWSERWQRWSTVAEAMDEMYPENMPSLRLEDMRSAGTRFIEVLGAGDERDCPVCQTLRGKVFAVDAAPSIAPDGCTCEPWCRCLYIAVDPTARTEPKQEPPPLPAAQKPQPIKSTVEW